MVYLHFISRQQMEWDLHLFLHKSVVARQAADSILGYKNEKSVKG